ncbi:hypothetical protein BC940DRAFT_314784 [Gongronella butleri]|nr:hypothetical protein BC940DRAFT_314784 [Gongronella butleri]
MEAMHGCYVCPTLHARSRQNGSFMADLMKCHCNWAKKARTIIMEKFKGDHLAAAHYLAELHSMRCKKTDNLLDFIDLPATTTLRSAGVVQDSIAFGAMLLEKLDFCFDRLTAQVRTVHAIPPSNRREEALTVAFIMDRAPRLFSEKWDLHQRTHQSNHGNNSNHATHSSRSARSAHYETRHRGNRNRDHRPINTRLSMRDDVRNNNNNFGRNHAASPRENRFHSRSDRDPAPGNNRQQERPYHMSLVPQALATLLAATANVPGRLVTAIVNFWNKDALARNIPHV